MSSSGVSYIKYVTKFITGSKLKVGRMAHTHTHTQLCHESTCSSTSGGKVAKISLVVKVTACAHSLGTTVQFRTEVRIFALPPLCPEWLPFQSHTE